MEWLAEPVTLPRYVVWSILLTAPALWSTRFREFINQRFPGDGGGGSQR